MSKSKNALQLLVQDFRTKIADHWKSIAPSELQNLVDGAVQMARSMSEDFERPSIFEVGFIGRSQIGKSTLLNALLSDAKYPRILPSGGLGPLTATSMSVSFGDQRRLEVIYHKVDALNRVVFSIRQSEKGLTDDSADSDEDQTNKEDREKKRRDLLAELRTIIAGDQNENRAEDYLLQVASSLVSKTPVDEIKALFVNHPSDELNYVKVLHVLNLAKKSVVYTEALETFPQIIKDHSAGCLSPLVAEISLQWPADLLRGEIVVTDLPGVGVVGDKYPEKTKAWMMKKGRSVILVTDNSGIDETSARTLRESNFLQRLLFSVDNPSEDPIKLIIAVNQMDKLIQDQDDDAKAESDFTQNCINIVPRIRTQLEDMLMDLVRAEANAELKADKHKVANQVLSTIEIIPLSAEQYIRSMTNNRRAAFRNAEVSRVPVLSKTIAQHASAFFLEKEKREIRRSLQLVEQIELALDQTTSRYQSVLENEGMSNETRAEFSTFAAGVKSELQARQAEFNSYVKRTVPKEIELMIANVKLETNKSYRDYCSRLDGTNWQTLKAAIRRGGTYAGASRIELQETLTNIMVELIAIKFPKTVIQPTKDQGKLLIESHIRSVERAMAWLSERRLPKRLQKEVDLIQRRLKADSEAMKGAGDYALKELRQAVKASIHEVLRDSIADACDSFMRSPKAKGLGVKGRMLELVETAGYEAAEEAGSVARRKMVDLYSEVFKELVTTSIKIYQKDLVEEIEGIFKSTGDVIAQKDFEKTIRSIQPKLKEIEGLRGWLIDMKSRVESYSDNKEKN